MRGVRSRRALRSVREWLPRSLLLGLSIVGWGLFLSTLSIMLIAAISRPDRPLDPLGMDSYAYWLAGRRLLDGESLYIGSAIDQLGAYFYPPLFAQAWMPLAGIDLRVVDWAWKAVMLLSIRYMAQSWLMTGIWMLYPGTLTELSAGNVTFPLAALTVAGLRGRAEGVALATLVKFSAAAVAPYIWVHRPEARRRLLLGALLAGALVTLSLLMSPGLWQDYLDSLGSQGRLTLEGTDIIHILPTAGADFALRLVVALILVVVSVRLRSPHLAYIASLVATPTIWPSKLGLLLALVTLDDDSWVRAKMRRPRAGVRV